jgi:hypothetical protein
MMVSPSRLSLVTGTAFVGVALICAMLGSGRVVSSDARERAHEATNRLESLAGRQPDSVRALALAYLERARLGLGDPFRLVDESMSDPRLDDSTGATIAWAILDRVFERGTYEIDASVLDAVGPPGAGADHLALIERVLRSSHNPRVAETTLRLAYGLAAARGIVSYGASTTIVEVAALVRDRVLAESDLSRAVRLAISDGGSVLAEVMRLRATRDLSVERPLLQALSPA